MSRRGRWSAVAAVVTALSLLGSRSGAQEGAPPPVRARAAPNAGASAGAVALTIEGGGSLGAYEAGMSWALVEAFRQRRLLDSTVTLASRNSRESNFLARLPRLDLVTSAGASAGSINALLASISWCSAAAAQPPESSSFWRAWMPSGIEQLIPAPRTPDWSERGIFTPRHLRTDVLPDVRKAWSRGGFVRGCRVAFGATITKASADSVLVAKSLYARNQRFAAAAVVGAPEARGAAGPTFTQPTLGAQSFGPTGYLLSLPDSAGVIASTHIEQLITASSAYPLAFAPAPLQFCRASSDVTPNVGGRLSCTRPDSADFLDGAIFDNGPLALAYDLAHATEPTRTRAGLYLLYVTPDRRRGTSDNIRRNTFLARAEGSPVGGESRPPSGLDAGLALIGNFIPAARQYELQLAARTLPQSSTVEEQLARKEAALIASAENVRRFATYADSEHVAHERAAIASDSAWARALGDESAQRRQAQYVGAICRMRPAECGNPTVVDSLIATGGVDSIPAAPAPPRIEVQEPSKPERATPDSIAPEAFAHTFFVSTRWHPLAGEWLSGIGAFLGEPLREYDFYVGVYDALALMARDAICASAASPDQCTARTLRAMIEDPPVTLSRRARMALSALYRAEYSSSADDSTSRGEIVTASPVTPHDSLVIAVIDAMQQQMHETSPRPVNCPRKGSFVQRAACAQGIDAFFAALRSNGAAMRAIHSSADACERGGPDDACFADRDFLRVVRNPGRELNRISELSLHRLDETTPAGGPTKPLLILASATYYSTNEAARSGWDFGSTSLPSSLYAAACDSLDYGNPALRHIRRCAQGALRFYPSSVGVPLFPSSSQYAEWTLRYNWPGTFSAGIVTRLMTSNGRRLTGGKESAPRMIEAPGLRFERKLGNLLVPTVGLDVAYWLDSNHPLFHQPGVDRTAYGATATILASKLRFAVTRIPEGYHTKGSQTLLWTAGLGDVNGMIYWLWRLTTE